MSDSMREAFARAYKDGQWHNGSGSGSSPANTRQYRAFLARYMAAHGVRSVLDLGCGDWQSSRLIDWTGIDYLGVDVVPGIAEANTVRFGRPGVRFMCADVLNGWELPPADLVLCKDLLQHWPDAAAYELIESRLGGRRALLTYDYGHGADIEPGGYRPLDLEREPFAWPVREMLRYESVSHDGKVRRLKVTVEL